MSSVLNEIAKDTNCKQWAQLIFTYISPAIAGPLGLFGLKNSQIKKKQLFSTYYRIVKLHFSGPRQVK